MKLKSVCCMGILALCLVPLSARPVSAQDTASQSASQSASPSATPVDVSSIPLDKLVTATCRQAWHLGGKTQDGFYAIVERLTELSAANRKVTLPDDKAAGERAGQWIHTQALKDPDQLLYAVVDHAVQYSISKGRTTSTAKSSSAAPSK